MHRWAPYKRMELVLEGARSKHKAAQYLSCWMQLVLHVLSIGMPQIEKKSYFPIFKLTGRVTATPSGLARQHEGLLLLNAPPSPQVHGV